MAQSFTNYTNETLSYDEERNILKSLISNKMVFDRYKKFHQASNSKSEFQTARIGFVDQWHHTNQQLNNCKEQLENETLSDEKKEEILHNITDLDSLEQASKNYLEVYEKNFAIKYPTEIPLSDEASHDDARSHLRQAQQNQMDNLMSIRYVGKYVKEQIQEHKNTAIQLQYDAQPPSASPEF